jgi:NADH-quinone oxidoreductase subunit M
MATNLLSLLIFIPIAAALFGLFLPASNKNAFRYLSLLVSTIQLILLIAVINVYLGSQGVFRLIEHNSWISLDLGAWGILQADYFMFLSC